MLYNEHVVSDEEAASVLPAIKEFINQRLPNVACFMTTLRKDGRPAIRQVGSFITGWTVETATQPWHVKNKHIRRNPLVTYLWVELHEAEHRMVRNVMLQGECQIIESAEAVKDFDERRRQALGRNVGASDHERWLLRTHPTYLRAEGFTGPRRPVILTAFD